MTVRHDQQKVTRKPVKKALQQDEHLPTRTVITPQTAYQDALVVEGEGLYIGEYDKRDGTC